MSLFRRLFYKKPPEGVLEISERVYVFDCCFSTEEDDDLKVYMGGIVGQLSDQFPDASFMLFNFRDGERQSQIARILSDYDVTVMDYPRHYEGCPLLTMEMILHFLRSSESWISLGNQNLLLMHCERGGWPVLAFMLTCFLIYIKQYTEEQKTLEMIYKQAPPEVLHLLSPLNPLPSQLRYLHYVSKRNVGSEWPPLDRALALDCIILRMLPNFDAEGGFRPIFRIYGQDPFLAADRTPKLLFSTPKKSKVVRHYKQADCIFIKIDIHCHIQGDIVFECISSNADLVREVMIFRVMFNTAFIWSNILTLNRDEIDILWDATDRFPKDFRAEVLFADMDATGSIIPAELAIGEEKSLPVEDFFEVEEIFSSLDWLDPKADVSALLAPSHPPPPPPPVLKNTAGPFPRPPLTLKNEVGSFQPSPPPSYNSSLSQSPSHVPPVPPPPPFAKAVTKTGGPSPSTSAPSVLAKGRVLVRSDSPKSLQTAPIEIFGIMEHSRKLEENLQDLLQELNRLKRVGEELGKKGEQQVDLWLQNLESSNRDMDEIQKEVYEIEEDVDELRSMELNMKVIQNLEVVKTLKESALQIFLRDIIGNKLNRFSHGDLDSFTSKFSKQIGFGGYGKVYLGQFPNDGFQVAVKVLMQNEVVEEIFMIEVNTMLKTSHPNLIKLHGFCFDSNTKALVYEYMEKGSLDHILHKKPLGIKWEKLYDIAIEIAKALAYLHHGCEDQIIHHDLKPANVLLDTNLSAKVADFGTARIISRDVSSFTMTKIRGTRGYTAPEMVLQSSRVTCTCDVYSFGMMLFDFLGMRNNTFLTFLPGQVWEKLRKGKLDEAINQASIKHRENDLGKARILSVVALWCVQFTPHIRPSMINVADALEKEIPVSVPPDPSFSWKTDVSMQLTPGMNYSLVFPSTDERSL